MHGSMERQTLSVLEERIQRTGRSLAEEKLLHLLNDDFLVCLRAGFRRYSFSSILQCSIHWPHACCETFVIDFFSQLAVEGRFRESRQFLF